jgi:DNA-binding transcriptional ArsR family regulator/protein-L-isoaspartate O-methyltransferase
MNRQADNQAAVESRDDAAESLFRALADRTRQQLMQLLVHDELNVSELVAVLAQPQSTISRHLKVLREAGLVSDRRDGATVLYTAVRPASGGSSLRSALTDWLGGQHLPRPARTRLERVLQKRRDEALGFFDRLGRRWDELRSEAFGDTFAWEAFLTLLPRDWVVADLGTGTGFLLPSLARHFRRVVAVEPAPAMLDCARQRTGECGVTNVRFHQGDLERLPLRSQTCDLTIACLVLHHLVDPAMAVGEMHRVLRPRGRLLIVEQQTHDNQAFQEMMLDRRRGFGPAELVRLVSAAGLAEAQAHDLATKMGRGIPMEPPALFVVTATKLR